MNEAYEHIGRLVHSPAGRLQLIASLVISTCAVAIFAAVFLNFLSCSRGPQVKKERKSVVATGSMILFFVFLYTLIRLRVGVLAITSSFLQVGMVIVGLTIIVFGCGVNIMGRLHLGKNWANQATIYNDQKLVTSGVYSLVRHPLYASLIWMFYGASLVYANVAAFLATSLIFVPFMVYRARLEEDLLAREFNDYNAYKRRVGMFLPGLGGLLSGGGKT